MPIEINPNRLRFPPGKSGERRTFTPAVAAQTVVPKRAHVNHIPSPESLATLIASAVESLRRGMRWERGTILNLLV